MSDEQTKLEGVEISSEEAEQFDLLSAKYFSAQQNVPYELTFSRARLARKMVKRYQSEEMEEKVVLELIVNSINGKNTVAPQEWNIKSKKLRDMFDVYYKDGRITKKVFLFKIKGMGKETNYTLATKE